MAAAEHPDACVHAFRSHLAAIAYSQQLRFRPLHICRMQRLEGCDKCAALSAAAAAATATGDTRLLRAHMQRGQQPDAVAAGTAADGQVRQAGAGGGQERQHAAGDGGAAEVEPRQVPARNACTRFIQRCMHIYIHRRWPCVSVQVLACKVNSSFHLCAAAAHPCKHAFNHSHASGVASRRERVHAQPPAPPQPHVATLPTACEQSSRAPRAGPGFATHCVFPRAHLLTCEDVATSERSEVKKWSWAAAGWSGSR